jgi:hypothetical protein
MRARINIVRRVKLLGSLGRAPMKNNNKQIEILAASFNLIIWPACRDKMPLMGTFTVQQWRKLLILPVCPGAEGF